ncbi:MAG: flagellar basal body-associated FliL family protein [Bacillota bacterium]
MADENNEGKNNNFIKLIAIFLLMVIVAAGTSYGVMTYFTSTQEEEQKTEQKAFGPTYTLGDFTVNLSDSGGYQFIKASIVVEVSDEKVIEELEKRSPQLRDVLISNMREASVNEIEEPGAKSLKIKIKNELNTVLGEGQIENVWFTQLVIQ